MQMADSVLDPIASKLRRPPQISLALDRETRVLYVNRDLAGTGFAGLTDDANASLHDLIHPDCDGSCRFNTLLRKAWTSLEQGRGSIEWEIDDAILECRLRLNLSKPPTPRNITVERRRRFALLIATDITEIRREYQMILAGNKDLLKRVDELERVVTDLDEPGPELNNARNDSGYSDSRLLRQLNCKIITAQEHERRRIAADLHDGVAQTLGVVKYGVEVRLAKLRREYQDLDLSDFDPVIEQIREAVEDVRNISRNLSPSVLDEFGICVAVDMLCNEFSSDISSLDVDCSICIDEVRIPDIVKVSIYRVVQEALNNIRKHAAASRVEVGLVSGDGGLSLTIRDDGAGFAAAEKIRESIHSAGLGLGSMRERIEATGGNFILQSLPGEGTVVLASWPNAALQLLCDQPVLDRV
jgi:signal transduction histidine kinase